MNFTGEKHIVFAFGYKSKFRDLEPNLHSKTIDCIRLDYQQLMYAVHSSWKYLSNRRITQVMGQACGSIEYTIALSIVSYEVAFTNGYISEQDKQTDLSFCQPSKLHPSAFAFALS